MLLNNTLRIFKASLFQFLGISILISFLLFFLNILFGLSYNLGSFTQDLRHKLGIYFYIKDNGDLDKTYSAMNELSMKLTKEGMQVEFYSKEKALELFSKANPDVIKNFQKYGIDNPLPPTLYVTFDSNEKYMKLKEIVNSYKDLIINTEDVGQGQNYAKQEERIRNVINLSNFLMLFSYFLIGILVIIILSFLMLVIKITFNNFYKQIEIEKLLGAFYYQIKIPFLANVLAILAIGFALMSIYGVSFVSYLDQYLIKVFNMNMMGIISQNTGGIILALILQFVLISALGVVISNFFLDRLIKKI